MDLEVPGLNPSTGEFYSLKFLLMRKWTEWLTTRRTTRRTTTSTTTQVIPWSLAADKNTYLRFSNMNLLMKYLLIFPVFLPMKRKLNATPIQNFFFMKKNLRQLLKLGGGKSTQSLKRSPTKAGLEPETSGFLCLSVIKLCRELKVLFATKLW